VKNINKGGMCSYFGYTGNPRVGLMLSQKADHFSRRYA